MTTTLPEFPISRTFNAPRERVWKAFTQPEHMQKWYAPKGFTSRAIRQEFRPGGIYHYCLTSPDGHEMWGKVTYREIVAPERVVYINAFSDAEAGITRHPMSATWPLEMHTTCTLTEQNGQTTLTVKWVPENATPEEIDTFDKARAGMTQGWGGTLDNLTEYLANNPQL
jgi:uncharacterized protein YndB with AHSA1/START domain